MSLHAVSPSAPSRRKLFEQVSAWWVPRPPSHRTRGPGRLPLEGTRLLPCVPARTGLHQSVDCWRVTRVLVAGAGVLAGHVGSVWVTRCFLCDMRKLHRKNKAIGLASARGHAGRPAECLGSRPEDWVLDLMSTQVTKRHLINITPDLPPRCWVCALGRAGPKRSSGISLYLSCALAGWGSGHQV